MRVFSVTEMREAEEYTMKTLNISVTELMFKAGKALAEDFLSRVKPEKSSRILMVSGTGNNGGDGLVLTKELLDFDYQVELMIIGDMTRASESFKHYLDGINVILNVRNDADIDNVKETFEKADYILDGIFGIGLKREVSGVYRSIIDIINETNKPVYSLDIPSGISPENGIKLGTSIKAKFTGVVGNLKLGNLLNDALDHHGEIEILDIGIISNDSQNITYLDFHDVDINPLERTHNSNKYTYGLGLFIGGSKTMMGAIQMAAMSSLRSGLGIARVFYEESATNITQLFPELILQSYNKYETIKNHLPKAKAIVFGPGMEKNSPASNRVLDHLLKKDIPLLIDAGGLAYINTQQSLESNHCVLTPHAGELARMFSVDTKEVLNAPLEYIGRLTEKGYVVLYKGPATIISDQKKTYILQAKNPGLAKAGTGDVLSGIIAAYLISNDPISAAIKGMALHSLAAETAREKIGVCSMTASDVIKSIGDVLKGLK